MAKLKERCFRFLTDHIRLYPVILPDEVEALMMFVTHEKEQAMRAAYDDCCKIVQEKAANEKYLPLDLVEARQKALARLAEE